MSRKCLKCQNLVPKSIIIDGKKSNCQRRKYCFECSPFGLHNTKAMNKLHVVSVQQNICEECHELHSQKGRKCFKCYFNYRKLLVSEKVNSLVDCTCWRCGYDRCKRNIHFHHVDPETKLFELSTRELMLKWTRVWAELQKCVALCANCHGEVHEGLISPQEIRSLWEERWKKILAAVP